MIKLTKIQKVIMDKYFVLNCHDPLNYYPITDKEFLLNPFNVIKIIDLIIEVLQSPEALFIANFPEYIDPIEIKHTITRKFDETDDEFRKRILEKLEEMKYYR